MKAQQDIWNQYYRPMVFPKNTWFAQSHPDIQNTYNQIVSSSNSQPLAFFFAGGQFTFNTAGHLAGSVVNDGTTILTITLGTVTNTRLISPSTASVPDAKDVGLSLFGIVFFYTECGHQDQRSEIVEKAL